MNGGKPSNAMAIDKDSSGLPEVDLNRPTTKVNLGIIAAAAIFFVVTFAIVMFYARRSDAETNRPSPPIQSESAPPNDPAKQDP